MQNECVRYADGFKIISEGNTTILHSAFCILHYAFTRYAYSPFIYICFYVCLLTFGAEYDILDILKQIGDKRWIKI